MAIECERGIMDVAKYCVRKLGPGCIFSKPPWMGKNTSLVFLTLELGTVDNAVENRDTKDFLGLNKGRPIEDKNAVFIITI